MLLKKYQTKRKFEKTPEPRGKELKTGKNRFVIQKHQARNLHYDFRLEMPSDSAGKNVVLKSWAVPKGLPGESDIKRLAVQVEDHPVDYIDFAGIIPAGQYGAGKVEIFDQGKYKLIEQDKNKIIFELMGKKFKGNYALIKMKQTKNWLIWKTRY